MDDADELREKARAPNSGAEPVSEVARNKESIAREEGELSSSENDELGDDGEKHGSCIAASTGMVIHPKVPVSLSLEKRSNPRIKDGEAVYNFSTLSSLNVQSQMSIQPAFKEKFDNNQTFPATTSGLGPSFNGSSNLVISFSDNDSGSEDEESNKEKDSKRQNDCVKNRRPPTSLQAKFHKNSQTFKNASKVITKKLPFRRSFVPSMTKTRGNNSMAAGPVFLEQGSRLRSFNTLNRSKLNPEPGFDQSLSLNDSKLKDLREQIALRENELKLKSVPLNKESMPARNQNDMNWNDAKGLKNSAILPGSMQVEPREPDKKRLKGSGSYTTHQFSGGPQELPLANKKIVSPSALLGVDSATYSDGVKKDILIERSLSKMDQDRKHNHMQLDSLPENIPRQQDGSPLGNHLNHSDEGKQTITNSNHRSNIDGQFTSTSNPTTAKQLVRSDFPKEASNHKTQNTCQGPMLKRINWDDVGMTNFLDVKSIVKIEESIDKDLEEAQEHRHRCEIAERNAFKAYRQAQRTLAEANARCVDLYRKRELYAAHIRSLMIESSSSMFSGKDHVGISDALANVPENIQLHRSDLQIQPEFQGFGLLQNDSNTQLANSDIHSSNQEVSEHVMESEPCTEPVGVISERLPHEGKTIAAGVHCSSSDPSILVDGNKAFPFENRSIEPSIKYLLKVRDVEDGNKINDEAKENYFSENAKDSLLLEARLRSELVQKLGKRNLQKNYDSCHDLGPERERGSQADVRNENSLVNNIEPHVNKEFLHNIECDKNQISELIAPVSDSKENQRRDLKEGSKAEFSSCLKSVFQHVKAIPHVSLEFLAPNHCRGFSSQNYDEEEIIKFNGFQLWKSPSSSIHETVGHLCGREIGSYSCNDIIDSYLPICMYELRGKCNNDECPWQHIKKVSKQNINQHHDLRSDFSDRGFSQCQKADDVQSVMKYQDSTTPTTYIVGLDILKSNLSPYGSCLIWRSDRCWKQNFSISLTLSIFSQKGMDIDGTFFHDGRMEVHEHYNKLAFLQSKNSEIQVRQALADSEQSLEMALLILNQEANKLDGLKKALPVLSRAVEADPTSAVIWIVYLLVFYSTMNPVGKDDMFSFAVKQIDRSYELWLLYINSRMQLDARLNAYEDAISALCYHATFDGNGLHDSACILDLFLQMINCLCISGNIEKAMKKILSAVPVSRNSDEGHSGLFSDILACLTVSDKCIFWVCCLYLVNYGKLPDVVVKQFECEKELNELDWPEVPLTDGEKWRVVQLLETAVDNFDSGLSAESCKSKDNLRSAQVFALNHIRCVLALNGVDQGRNLLAKYTKLYPFCLELILLSARTDDKRGEDGVNFKGFEECLKNWPKEVPGVQCVWNQYAEYALQNGRYEYAKELMALWFDSVWTARNSENGAWDLATSNTCDLLRAIRDSDSNQIDLLFGYINLSLHMLLQNNDFEARLAIDNALKAVGADTIRHCLKEYATFLLSDESLLKEVASVGGVRSIFEGYISNVCALSALKPLSRNFITKIKKPRVQQLVGNLLNPFSPNFSLMNLVLQVWFGPSLLPRNFNEPKGLVDFVETVMEMLPSNYEVAISVCKLFGTANAPSELTLPSFLFWAGSNLINAISHAIPIPPEFVWVEAAGVLGPITGMEAMIEKFYKRGLSVYPFSVELWKSYYSMCKTRDDSSRVIQQAKARGIDLV